MKIVAGVRVVPVGEALASPAETEVSPTSGGNPCYFFKKFSAIHSFAPYGDTDVPIGTIKVAVSFSV